MPRRKIEIPIGPSIAYIPLTKNQSALIDSDVVDKLPNLSWIAEWNPYTKSFYAVTYVWNGEKQNKVRLHRHLLGFPPFVDHRNHNTLDNRICNLRSVTKSQNCQNARHNYGELPHFKGVGYFPTRNKWRARIGVNGKSIIIGYFKTPEEAYSAYKAAALKHHGEFACF
jgi:hypothetical protein